MKKEVVEALNKLKPWIQEAARRLVGNGTLSEDDVDFFVKMIKEPEPPTTSLGAYPSTKSPTPSVLRIRSIGGIVGIDALRPRKPLDLGEKNLSVIYGANGSGKSGYARIITKACGARHSIELKPDVFQNEATSKQCDFKYCLGGNEKSLTWDANGAAVSDFETVNVFDTENGRLYLEKDNELSYEIPELTVFSELVSACKRVDAKLSAEKQKLASHLPQLPNQFRETSAGKSYLSLAATTSPEAIEKLLQWTDVDEAELKRIRLRLQTGDPAAEAEKQRSAKKQIDLIHTKLSEAAKAIDAETMKVLERARADAAKHQKASEEGAKALGDASELGGVGSETWKSMWEAAREYSRVEAYTEADYPNTDEHALCVLCQQGLGKPAKKRLGDFESFVKGKLESDAADADRLLNDKLENLPAIADDDQIESTCLAAKLNAELKARVKSAWVAIREIVVQTRDAKNLKQPVPTPLAVKTIIDELAALSAAANTEAKELDKQAASADNSKLTAALGNLKSRKWMSEQAVAFRAEFERLKKVAQYDKWKKETATTGISRQAGKLSEKLITGDYVKRFNDELKRLGARRLKVELVKTNAAQGKVKHGVALKGLSATGTKTVEILSEGERRIVAIAAFLADVTGQQSKGPFVFDDPISSLDQSFEERITNRLITLSEDRQVIVFTHRLSFLGMMNDIAASKLNDIFLRRESWGTGEPGEVPLFGKKPDRALKTLMNERLAQAKKVYEADGAEAYHIHGKAICSDFRILLERVVETVFLADVIQRHRRAIHTQNKVDKLARINSEDCKLVEEMMTKYSSHEHSQSAEAPVDLPNPDELKIDIQKMLDWHGEFSKRT